MVSWLTHTEGLFTSIAKRFVSRYIAIQRTVSRYVSQYIVVILVKISDVLVKILDVLTCLCYIVLNMPDRYIYEITIKQLLNM